MNCLQLTSELGCWLKSDGSQQTVAIMREFRAAENGEVLLYKTRYSLPDGTLVSLAAGESVTTGQCVIVEQPLSAPGALLSANICVGSPIFPPPGNSSDLRTVGTGGDYADFVSALADVTVVDGTILRAVSDVIDTATVNVNRAVVIDLDGFTHTNSVSVTVFNVTAALAVIKNGILNHAKVANTSVESNILTNAPGVVYIVDNTIKVQEFGVTVRGGAMIVGNSFEYVGASATNNHRFIAFYNISHESRVDNNKFNASTIPSTARYTNFIYLSSTAGSAWTAPLYVTRNEQTGGSLRQFFFNEALLPSAGSELIIAANSFNDFNGGIGIFSPTLYNGLDKVTIVDNVQGGDAAGNFKGVFFVDGTGTMDDSTVFVYGGNTTSAGPLRADYVSFASDTDNIIARKNTVVPPTVPSVLVTLESALDETGTLLQELKGKRTYINDATGVPLSGYGTEEFPYELPASTALWSAETGTLTNTDKTAPVLVETNDPATGTVASVQLGTDGTATLYGSDKVILNSSGEYEFIGVPEDADDSATKALVYNPSTYKVEYKDLLAITGDRYKTVSTTCNDIVSTGNVTFVVEPGLAYTPQQDIIALASTGNSMTGEVVSYNDITGDLVMSVQHKEGSGNFCNWIFNLDAVKIAAVSVYYNTLDPVTSGQVGVEGDFWYVTSNPASPSEQNVTEHWVYDWTLGWKRVWKKEYMFDIEMTDTFDAQYYYYGGYVGPDWQVHRYLHSDPQDPEYMVLKVASVGNNSSVTTLAAAWTARATLSYV